MRSHRRKFAGPRESQNGCRREVRAGSWGRRGFCQKFGDEISKKHALWRKSKRLIINIGLLDHPSFKYPAETVQRPTRDRESGFGCLLFRRKWGGAKRTQVSAPRCRNNIARTCSGDTAQMVTQRSESKKKNIDNHHELFADFAVIATSIFCKLRADFQENLPQKVVS